MSELTSGLKSYFRRFSDDDVMGLAAELAYRFLFALFPFAIFLAAVSAFVAGWLGIADPTTQIMTALGQNLPGNLAGPVRTQIEQVVGKSHPELLSIGALLALYAAAGGTNALMKAMNRAYDVRETRSLPLRLAHAIGLTLLGGVGVIVSFVVIVGGALVTEQAASKAGLGGAAWTLLSLLRWPAVLLVLVVAGAILFRYAPNFRPPWRFAVAGAVAFAIGWLVATFAFGFYVSRFGRFDATYGALGGAIVLMLWFYLTGVVLVGAAELVAVLVHSRAGEVLAARRQETGSGAAGRVADGARDAVEAAGRHMGVRRERAEPPAAGPSARVPEDTETEPGTAADRG